MFVLPCSFSVLVVHPFSSVASLSSSCFHAYFLLRSSLVYVSFPCFHVLPFFPLLFYLPFLSSLIHLCFLFPVLVSNPPRSVLVFSLPLSPLSSSLFPHFRSFPLSSFSRVSSSRFLLFSLVSCLFLPSFLFSVFFHFLSSPSSPPFPLCFFLSLTSPPVFC